MPDSVGHRCYFISQSTKALQLKKGLNFNINNVNKINKNINKITSQSKLYIDCSDCGTVYVF